MAATAGGKVRAGERNRGAIAGKIRAGETKEAYDKSYATVSYAQVAAQATPTYTKV